MSKILTFPTVVNSNYQLSLMALDKCNSAESIDNFLQLIRKDCEDGYITESELNQITEIANQKKENI